MSRKQSISELYAALSAPLPQEAISHGWNGLSTINDAFVRERLNEVLGPDGWMLKPKPQIISCEPWRKPDGSAFVNDRGAPYWEVTATVAVYIAAFRKTYWGEGGNVSTDRGDARKGAVTDAFGKALQDLIGKEVYKGEYNDDTLKGKGAKALYRCGVESGWIMCKDGLTLEDALKAAAKDLDKVEQIGKD
jgi:hypothetical protein